MIDSNKNIVIVAHKFLTQPDDDLILFLNKNRYRNVLHVCHSFADALDRSSYFNWYRDGELYKSYRTKDYKDSGEFFIYFKELFFTIKWIWRKHLIWDWYIGMDGLCSVFGLILKLFGRTKKVIYWAIDFVPSKRFKAEWKNRIYSMVNRFAYRRVDEMWDLGIRMAEAREKFIGITKNDYKFHRVVPYGVWIDRIEKYEYKDCQQNTVVFMGHLLEKQGAQLIVSIMPEIIKKIPQFRFKIIGTGPYKEFLIDLAGQLDVLGHCDFMGKIDDINELENEIAKSCVAVAPYIKELDTWTYYADPGKIKTYLACGVPVLLTDIPWNSSEIESNGCGKIITEDKNEILEKLLELMNSGINQKYRDNAIIYSSNFDYENIFININI